LAEGEKKGGKKKETRIKLKKRRDETGEKAVFRLVQHEGTKKSCGGGGKNSGGGENKPSARQRKGRNGG